MTNSLKLMALTLTLGSISTGFAMDPVQEFAREMVESETPGYSDTFARYMQLAYAGVKSGMGKAYAYGAQGANWVKETSAYQTASDKVAHGYGVVAQSVAPYYGAASDKAEQLRAATSLKVADMYGAASEYAQDLKVNATENVARAYTWASDKTPNVVKTFVANHPYISLTAVVAPIALYIGYKWRKAAQSQADLENDWVNIDSDHEEQEP